MKAVCPGAEQIERESLLKNFARGRLVVVGHKSEKKPIIVFRTISKYCHMSVNVQFTNIIRRKRKFRTNQFGKFLYNKSGLSRFCFIVWHVIFLSSPSFR